MVFVVVFSVIILGFALFQATVLFVQLDYTLATEEAERIGVDHVARMSSGDTGDNSAGKELFSKVNEFFQHVLF